MESIDFSVRCLSDFLVFHTINMLLNYDSNVIEISMIVCSNKGSLGTNIVFEPFSC